MSGIHEAVMLALQERLQQVMIDDVPGSSQDKGSTRAGVIILGPLQGDPDPDQARISVEIHENDPDQEITGSGLGAAPTNWQDQVEEVEIGNTITFRRGFTVKIRCLFDLTRETLSEARNVVSVVRARAEKTIMGMSFFGVIADDGEYVSRGTLSDDLITETSQSGGPPDSYDFRIKIRFTILTTSSIVQE